MQFGRNRIKVWGKRLEAVSLVDVGRSEGVLAWSEEGGLQPAALPLPGAQAEDVGEGGDGALDGSAHSRRKTELLSFQVFNFIL